MRIFLILFALFFSGSAYSATYWVHKVTVAQRFNIIYDVPVNGPNASFCDAKVQESNPQYPWTRIASNGTTCEYYTGNNQWAPYFRWQQITAAECPAERPYIQEDDSCSDVAPECPFGQVNLGEGCVDICVSTSPPKDMWFQSPMPINYTDNYSTEGACEMQLQEVKECRAIGTIGAGGDTSSLDFYCLGSYQDTGVHSEAVPEGDDDIPGENVPDVNPEVDNRQTTTEVTTDPIVTSGTDPVITESGKTTEMINDAGTYQEWIGDSLVVYDSTGSIIEIIEQKTQNIYSDGSGFETTETIKSNLPASGSITRHDPLTGESTTEIIPEQPAKSQTTTTTKTYGPGGVQTAVNTTTEGEDVGLPPGTGSGDGEGEGGSAFCDYATIVCDTIEWLTKDPELGDPEVPEIEEFVLEGTEFNSGLPTLGQCPSDENIPLGSLSGSVSFSYQPICGAMQEFRPWVLLSAATISIYMLVRARD